MSEHQNSISVPAPSPKTIEALADAFDLEMRSLYNTIRRSCGYTPSYFRKMLAQHGGLQTAKILLARPTISSGFGELWMRGATEMTVEALVIESPWCALFSPEELHTAESRLSDVNLKAA
jgi:hypothetical protein